MSRCIILSLSILFLVPGCSGSVPPNPKGSQDQFKDMETIKNFQTMRESSADQEWEDGNRDARQIQAGKTLELCNIKGPGRIAHIWFTIKALDRFYPRTLVLRIYWDDNINPCVECPVGDFFGVGHGVDVSYSSAMFQVSSEGRARNCYWPMPFKKSARVTVTNESSKNVQALYWYIDWQKLDSFTDDMAYFHAHYRQSFPCEKGKDYVVADITGCGHYVGTVESTRLHERGWFGEGDDRFFIDGEKAPSLKGTGTEDYFCDAWGYRKFNYPYYGVTIWDGFDAGALCSTYRWHVKDPVSFRKSLKVTFEHKGSVHRQSEKDKWFVERLDDYASVAYWYQLEPHPALDPLPPAKDRLLFDPDLTHEAESQNPPSEKKEGDIQIQDKPSLSGWKQMFFKPTGQNASITLEITIKEKGSYHIGILATRSFDSGKYQVQINGENFGRLLDLYDAEPSYPIFGLGIKDFDAGKHQVRFVLKGKRAPSDGSNLGIDAILLKKQSLPK